MHLVLSRLRHQPPIVRLCILLALIACQVSIYLLWPAAHFVWFFAIPNIILCSVLLSRPSAYVAAGLLGLGTSWMHMHQETLLGSGAPTSWVYISNLTTGLMSSLVLAWLSQSTNDDFMFFQVIVRDTQEFIYLLDPAGRVAFINEAGAYKLGYTREEVIGQEMHRFLPAWYHPLADQLLHSSFSTQGIVPKRIHILHRDGRELTLTANIQRLKWKGKTYVLGIGQDVTSSERIELLFTAAFDAIGSALAIRTLQGEIICCNEAFAASVGRTKTELVGSVALAFGLEPSSIDFLNRTVAHGEPQHSEFQTPDGKTVRANAYPIRNEHGDPIAVLTLAADVTDTKQAEAGMVQTARLAGVGQLAAGVAHNINNVLAAICVSAELLQLRPTEVGPHVARDILSAVDRGSAMVQKLYRLSGGSETTRAEHLSVAEAFRGVVQLTVTSMIRQGVELVQEIPEAATVYADANLLHQVLMNLVVNAMQAMPDEDGRLTLSARSHGQWVDIRVSDNGCGIEAEHLDRVFTPFFTTKGNQNGTGLGLSTSLRMVKAMGGDILVESQPGHGATFTVRLPVRRPASDGQRTELSPTDSEAKPGTGRD